MEQTYQDVEQKYAKPHKKCKPNQKDVVQDGEWIVVKSKKKDLFISISDFSKINRFYSHRSIQTYLRYILTQSVPNPMWLSIKRQSQIERILYIDLQIECNLFQSMLANKELPFLGSLVNESNKALFKCCGKVMREELWECLLCCQVEQDIKEIGQNKYSNQKMDKIDQNLYKKYSRYVLTPQEFKLHLYPTKDLPIYSHYYEMKNLQTNQTQWKNKILIVDCEMVSSQAGFQLARATIINFEGDILFDQLFKPEVHIVNYNTQFSGITYELIENVTNTPQNKLYPFLQTIMTKDTILVGHSLQNDLRAMKLIHKKVIDSSVLFMRKNGTKFKLKSLADKILKRKIQIGHHDSKEDCLATLHLIRAKIENDQQVVKKEYTVFKELEGAKKTAALIDFAIDYEMKQFSANHYQKVQRYEKSANILKIVKKYLRKDISIPNLVLTRIQRPVQTQWEDYYKQFQTSFKDLHAMIPKNTAIFFNCQVDPNIQILSAGQPLKPTSTIRNPCFMLAV